MFLAIDIGNTNTSFGIFDKNRIVHVCHLKTHSELDLESIKKQIGNFSINQCGIISVVNGFDTMIKTYTDTIFSIDAKILKSDTNAGIDRIANTTGAKKVYKTNPIIVIDSGSATTFDITDKNGKFIGGIIMPGLEMQLNTLNSKASKLPKVSIGVSSSIISTNTEDEILSGVIRASACAIDGMIEECEKFLKEKATIIGTGGNISLLSSYMKQKFDDINTNITLIGIKELFHDNF